MELIFWIALAIALYGYFGYGLILGVLSRLWGRPPVFTDALPRVTVIIAAYNEEAVMAEKLENTLALDYPRELLEILVVADGSSDRTVEIASGFPGVRVEFLPERAGKLKAINRASLLAQGELLLFSDANAYYSPQSLRKMVRHFGDPRVAAVAGEKKVLGTGVGSGEGAYWRYESWLKAHDSLLSSVMGAAGEIFMVRRERFFPLEDGIVIEDFVLSMELVRQGYLVRYEPEAIAVEGASASVEDEFKRKTRISAGGWQAVLRLWPLLFPTRPLITFQYVSHRVLRWMVIPLLLPLLLVLNCVLTGPLYRGLLGCQLAFYALALLGYLSLRRGNNPSRILLFPFYFSLFNLAALVGAVRFWRGWTPVVWEKAQRKATF